MLTSSSNSARSLFTRLVGWVIRKVILIYIVHEGQTDSEPRWISWTAERHSPLTYLISKRNLQNGTEFIQLLNHIRSFHSYQQLASSVDLILDKWIFSQGILWLVSSTDCPVWASWNEHSYWKKNSDRIFAMLIYSITRCLIVSLLLGIYAVHTHDIFDMFNNVKDQVAEKVDHAATKVKEKMQKHVLNLVGEVLPRLFIFASFSTLEGRWDMSIDVFNGVSNRVDRLSAYHSRLVGKVSRRRSTECCSQVNETRLL